MEVAPRLLALDVGNTNVTIGVFEGDRLAHSWRLAALRERTADELGIFVTRLFETAQGHETIGFGHQGSERACGSGVDRHSASLRSRALGPN